MAGKNNHHKRIILIGGGGHCRIIIDALKEGGDYFPAGIVDDAFSIRSEIVEVPVVGRDGDLRRLFLKGFRYAFIAIGAIGQPEIRQKISEALKQIGFSIPVLRHPSAVVSKTATLADGVFVGARAVIQAGSKIGEQAIINSGAVIDHDCVIGPYVHVAPGATLSGGVTVGYGTHIGTGTSVIENRKIGQRSFIGAGSVVVRDLPDRVKAMGNPCRVVERRGNSE